MPRALYTTAWRGFGVPVEFHAEKPPGIAGGPRDHWTRGKRCENGVDENVAVARCLVCCAYLCDACWKHHQKGIASRNHETVSLEAIKEGGEKKLHKPQFCLEHENEVLKLYCKTCSKTICTDCTLIDHKDHKYAFIKDVCQELRQELEGTMEGLRKKEGEFQEYLECLHRAQAEQGANVQACRQEVNRAFDSFVRRLQLCRDRVLEEIVKTEKADKKCLSAEADAMEVSLAKVSSNLSFIDRLLKSGSDIEVASMAAPTLERVKIVQGMTCQRKPEIVSGTLSAQVFKEWGQLLAKDFGEDVKQIENNLSQVAQGRPCDVVVEGIKSLSCGLNTLTIKIPKGKKRVSVHVEVTHIAVGTTASQAVPVALNKASDGSWTASFVVTRPGQLTVVSFVNGVRTRGFPFISTVEELAVGTRVRRGPDWKWGLQDSEGLGTVTGPYSDSGGDGFAVSVKWDKGGQNSYRWAKDWNGKFQCDLEPI